jgi:hypothetical protein
MRREEIDRENVGQVSYEYYDLLEYKYNSSVKETYESPLVKKWRCVWVRGGGEGYEDSACECYR